MGRRCSVLIAIFYVVDSSYSLCVCGRGGACLNYGTAAVIPDGISATPCSCEIVSKGIYEPAKAHCNKMIQNFCDVKPCGTHGTCFEGFGTFWCNCHRELPFLYMGRQCTSKQNIQYIGDGERKVSFAVWYPISHELQWATVILGVYFEGLAMDITLRFDYDRIWIRNYKSCSPVTQEVAIENCRKSGAHADCSTLEMYGSQMEQLVRCKVPLPFTLERTVYDKSGRYPIPIGQYHDVQVILSDRDYKVDYLNEVYRVYVETGDLNRQCPYKVTVRGCADTPSSADKVAAASQVTLSVSTPFMDPERNCPVQSKDYRWYVTHFVRTKGNFKPIAATQSVTFVPVEYGFTGGLATVQVEITFLQLPNLIDELVTAMCFVEIVPEPFEIHVNGTQLIYPCSTLIEVQITPDLVNLHYPMNELRFLWTCSDIICKHVEMSNPNLTFVDKGACGETFDLELTVTHPKFNLSAFWSGKLRFSEPFEYHVKLECQQKCTKVNPTQPLILIASDTLNLSQTFDWEFSPAVRYSLSICDSQYDFLQPKIVVSPNELKPGVTYSLTITTTKGSGSFNITTATAPSSVTCEATEMSPNTFNLNCSSQSDSPPVTYSIYEGPSNQLVLISQTPHMKNVYFLYPEVLVVVKDSLGLKESLKLNVNVKNDMDSDQYLMFIDTIQGRLEHVTMLHHENDFSGMVNEIDNITKIAKLELPYKLQFQLMAVLAKVKECLWAECIIKLMNSIDRLLLYKIDQIHIMGVDEFIFLAGGMVYRMTQSLYPIAAKNKADFPAYHLIDELNAIHATARNVMQFVDYALFHPEINEDIRRIHYRKVEMGNFYARSAITELGLFITKHIPHPMHVFELTMYEKGVKNVLTWIISHNVQYFNCFSIEQQHRTLLLVKSKSSDVWEAEGIQSSFALLHFKPTSFWWLTELPSTKEALGSTIEVVVYQRPQNGNWTRAGTIEAPVKTYTTAVNHSDEMEGMQKGKVLKPSTEIRNQRLLNGYVDLYRVIVPPGYGSLMLGFPAEILGYIHVSVSLSRVPTYYEMKNTIPFNETQISYNYYNERSRNIYIGVIANVEDHDYVFNYTLIRCVVRSEGIWKSEWCSVNGYHKGQAMACDCAHLSLFSYEISMPQLNRIRMIDYSLYTTQYDAWYVSVVICGIGIILGSIYVIIKAWDLLEKPKKTAMFLDDNWPGEDYPYLMAVFTGGRFMSGTSSHVGIRLIGSEAVSRVHVLLSDEYSTVPLTWGQDCWFVLFTSQQLGVIEKIEIWHDGIGTFSDWYCTEIIIWDINTGDRFQIPIRTWLSYTRLYETLDTSFLFYRVVTGKERVWPSYIYSHIHAKFRQEHHWASVFLLHQRSLYSQFDRIMLVAVIVMVSFTICMGFYMDNLGPGDRPKIKMTENDIFIALKTTLISCVIIMIPGFIFSVAKRIQMRKFMKNKRTKSKFQDKLESFWVHPVTYMPIMSKEMYKKETRKWNCWNWAAHVFCIIVISSCVGLMIGQGLNFGRNRTVIWVIASLLAVAGEAFIVNPIQVVLAALLCAYMTNKSARDIVIIDVDPAEDFFPLLNINQRLGKALHLRVKPMYKPPLMSLVKEKATKLARRELIDVYHVTVIILLLILVPLLIYYLRKELNYHKHLQLSELFEDQRSSGGSKNSIRNRTRYFDYLRATVLPSLHRYAWYNGVPLTWSINDYDFEKQKKPNAWYTGFSSDYSTMLVGVPQLRQQRLTPDSDKRVAPVFAVRFRHAYGPLNELNEDTEKYRPNWQEIDEEDYPHYKVYEYWTAERTRMSNFFGVSRRIYHGGGYVENLHWSLAVSLSSLIDLEVDNWLDNLTRVVFFTFNLYSIYEEKISYVTVITECLPAGIYRSRTMSESASVTYPREYIISAIVFCICLVVTLLLFRTLVILSKLGFIRYVKSVSGFVAICFILSGYCIAIAFVNRYFKFFAAIEEVQSLPKDAHAPLHSRFNQNYVVFISIAIFSVFATALAAIQVHHLIGFEAVNFKLARTRALIVAFALLNIFGIYVSFSLSYFGSGDNPNLFFLLFFREPTPIQDTVGLSTSTANYILFAVIVFLILTRLNLAVLVHFYDEAKLLFEPKTATFKKEFITLRSQLQAIQTLRTTDKKIESTSSGWRKKLFGRKHARSSTEEENPQSETYFSDIVDRRETLSEGNEKRKSTSQFS